MSGIEFNFMFDALMSAYGAFLIYSALKMKKTGEPSSAILPRQETTRCTDKEGFIQATYLKTILFGAVIVLYGVAEILNDRLLKNSYIDFAGMVVVLATFAWYIVMLRKIRSRFIR